jgi:hypothetical protein
MVLTFLGCPAEPEDKPAAPVYGIEVDRTSYAYYGPTGNVFTSPQPYAITVTNTGNAATGDIALRLVYDETPPAIAPIAISMDWAAEAVIASIPKNGSAQFRIYLYPFDTNEARSYSATVEITGAKIPTKEVRVTYTTVNADHADITVSGGEPLVIGQSGRQVSTADGDYSAATPWFSGDSSVAEIAADGTLTLKGPGKTFIGFQVSANPAAYKGDWVQVYEAGDYTRATLKALVLNNQTVYGFIPDRPPLDGGYVIDVPYSTATARVIAMLSSAQTNAGAAVDPAVQTVPLVPGGATVITVTVTAADRTTTSTYTITVNRPNITELTAITAKYPAASPFTAYLRGAGFAGIAITGKDNEGIDITIPFTEFTIDPPDFNRTVGDKTVTFIHASGVYQAAVPITISAGANAITSRPANGVAGRHLGMLATATSNVVYADTYAPQRAVDGNWENYGWATTSLNSFPKNLDLAFDAKVTVKRVVIWQEPNVNRIGQFKIRYVDANGDWQDAYTSAAYTALQIRHRSEWQLSSAIETDKLELSIVSPVANTTAYNPTILEFEVFDE